MFQRTPLISQRHPVQDKENVSIFTPTQRPGKSRTPAKALESPALTPLRQPLATVNGDGSGLRGQQLRRVSLKPALPRIEALRSEGVVGRADGTCTPRGQKTPGKTRRQKPKSCATTPSLPKAVRPKPAESVLDSITAQLFDRLVQEELNLVGGNTTVHNSRSRKSVPEQGITESTCESSSTVAPLSGQPSSCDASSEEISEYVDGIIDSAVQQLQLETRIDALESKLQNSDAANDDRLKSASSGDPTDQDISAYVDAVLSVQLRIVRSEYEEKLNSCLDAPITSDEDRSPICETQADSTLETLSPSNTNNDGVDDMSSPASPLFAEITPTRVTTRPPHVSTTPNCLLDALSSLNIDGTPLGSSPGYMLLPPRRDWVNQEARTRNESSGSDSTYEDEFLRFVHSQYGSRESPMKMMRPVMEDAAVGTPPKMADSSSNTHMLIVKDSQTGMSPLQFADTETFMSPLKLTDTETCMSPQKLTDTETFMSPLKITNTETSMTPLKHTDTETAMSPIKVSNMSTETSTIMTQESGTEMEAVVHRDAMVGTPVKMASVGVAMTPVKMSNFETNTSPTKLSDASTEMRIEVTDSGTDALQVEICDAMVGTPIKQSTAGVGTSPVCVQDTASFMTPVKMSSTGMGTSPSKVTDTGTEMPLLELTDAGVGTSPLPVMTESAAGTSPVATVDRNVGGTPITMSDMRCGTTPHQYNDGTTAMTQVCFTNTQTLTSPPVVPSLRFSSSPSTIESSTLVSHVQTATISNQLLRTEVQMLRSQKEEVEERLVVARRQIREKEEMVVVHEEKMGQLQRTARASLEKEMEDLMGQVGEQMMQIGQLEATVREKNQTVTKLNSEKQKLKQDYNQEISELQDDLCRAYKQHQQQLMDLKAEYKTEDYERHYTRSQTRVTELETQLGALVQLQDVLEKATHVQSEFAQVEKTYSDVESLFQLTMKQHQQVTSQKKEVEEERSRLESDKASWEQIRKDGEKKMQENEEKMEECLSKEQKAEEKQCLLEKDLSDANAIIKDLRDQLEAKENELCQKEGELSGLTDQYTLLEQKEVAHFLELQSQEAAMLAQAEQHASAQAQFERTKEDLQRRLDQLQKQCQSLSSEKLAAEVDIKSIKARLFSVEAELADTKRSEEEQGVRISALRGELEPCKDAKRELEAVESQLKTLLRQSLEDKQFLEEERTALEESAQEVEKELRITGMELARSKASLCEGDMIRGHLEESIASLSEQVEALQSELDHTKTQAHWMILNQGSEISNTSAALAELSESITSVLAKISEPPMEKVNEASTRGFVTERRGKRSDRRSKHKPSTPASSSSGSLVVSVLRAVQHIETPGKTSTSMAEDAEAAGQETPGKQNDLKGPEEEAAEGGERRLTIGQSGPSAFQVVKPVAAQMDASDGNTSDAGRASGDGRGVESLAGQVQSLKTVLQRIIEVLLEKEQRMAEETEGLQQEIADITQHAKRCSQRSDHQTSLLRDQLEESLSHRHQLQQELAGAQGRSCDQRQALDYAQQRMESMAANLARFSDQKSAIEDLEQQVSRLTSSLRLVTREKEMVMGQFEALASRPAQGASGPDGDSMARAARENLLLKKELEKVRMKYLKRQEDYELFHGKAARQMKVLEGNWKKAEAEIHRLDQLFEHCRQVIEKVPKSFCQRDPNLKLLFDMFLNE